MLSPTLQATLPMPIRFHCHRCHQLLGIASRKAGSDIACPKCGLSQEVPNEEAAAAAMAMDQFAQSEIAADVANLVVYDDQPAVIETARQRSSQQPSTGSTSSTKTPSTKAVATPPPVGSPAPEAAPVKPGQPVPGDMILYRRRTFYVQAVLMVVIAGVFFAVGYFIGRGDATYELQTDEENAARERIPIQGVLEYDSGGGKWSCDENAVAIALPVGKIPASKIPIQDLQPRAAAVGEESPAAEIIRRLGGAYTRADAEGKFYMAVPGEGTYHLLLISANARRGGGVEINDLELDDMGSYFLMPADLIGRFDYRWTTEEVKEGFDPIELRFPLQR